MDGDYDGNDERAHVMPTEDDKEIPPHSLTESWMHQKRYAKHALFPDPSHPHRKKLTELWKRTVLEELWGKWSEFLVDRIDYY